MAFTSTEKKPLWESLKNSSLGTCAGDPMQGPAKSTEGGKEFQDNLILLLFPSYIGFRPGKDELGKEVVGAPEAL